MRFPVVTHLLPVEELLPHRPPMILVDRVVATDGGRIECEGTVRSDNPFAEAGRVSSIIALEYMAQAVGCLLGLWTRQAGDRITGGLLLGSPALDLAIPAFAVGDRLTIRCHHIWGTDDVWKFDCTVLRGDEVLAAGILNVLRTDFGDEGTS